MADASILESRDRLLDTRGLLCPYPYIEARRTLESLPEGTRLEIVTDSEPTAMSSIPILCEQSGYTFTRQKTGDVWRLVVTKA